MPVASLSKSFTALAAVQLAERRMLALDSAVVHYLPELVSAAPGAYVRRGRAA